ASALHPARRGARHQTLSREGNMQFYRVASWLYAVIASLVVPLMVLDMAVDWPGLTAAWGTLFGLSVPLMVIQALGLRRVLRERAAEENVSTLVTWFWLLHLLGA